MVAMRYSNDMNDNLLLEANDLTRITQGERIEKEYFYIPFIFYSEGSQNDEYYWYSLRYNNKEAPKSLLAYASKVIVGKTLWEAVRQDLASDFAYTVENGSFVIENIDCFDTARRNDSRELTRLLVWVNVNNKFSVDRINPVSTKPFWKNEGEYPFNLINFKYFSEKSA
jgi:hypothetical protein